MISRRHPTAGLIDRSIRLPFTFDGQRYSGHPGDTIASALLANDVTIIGRGFKYHRPRGLWGAWVDEPNAIFNVRLNDVDFPNVPGATTPLQAGMDIRAINAWPSAKFDVKSALDLFHAVLPAGFYYKTFMWPDWHLFEPGIRRMAGLGRLTGETPKDFISRQQNDRCDLLVIGGGSAGLRAARLAATAGRDVVLVEDHPTLGGSLYACCDELEGKSPKDWIEHEVQMFQDAGGRLLTETTAFGVYDHGLIGLAQGFGLGTAPTLIRMRADRVVLATGALDRPATFTDNDRPGIMSLHATCDYLGRNGVLAGQTIATLSNHSMASVEIEKLRAAGATIHEAQLSDVQPEVAGRRRIKSVRLGSWEIRCDLLAVSAGRTPTLHLWRHAGGKLTWDVARAAFVPGKGPDTMAVIGAANGTFDIHEALKEAQTVMDSATSGSPRGAFQMTPHWPKVGSKGRQFIDFQHDVTLKDIELAARENYVSVEHLKRYTTLGMAVDQGKTSNMAGLAAMAALRDLDIPQVGTTTFRPPFVPQPLALYKGAASSALFHPLKRLPLEDLHRAENAALSEYGGWLRPAWYGPDTAQNAIASEALSARQSAAIFDASPLGKIELMGPDAAAFLDFIYYNTISSLKPSAIRYGFMLREDGVIFDDGVVARLDQDHFLVSCSSSHTDAVVAHLEAWRQDGNDPDNIFIHDSTQSWATLAISGPHARSIVGKLNLGLDPFDTDFAHMRVRPARFKGHPARVARVSFTGDLSFEISVPCDAGAALWQAARQAGAVPIGIEALSVLRAEKGYIMVGKDTDGETMPHDLGMTGPRDRKQLAYLGDRGLQSPQARKDDRQQLVGLTVPDDAPALPTGAHIVTGTGSQRRSVGFVTSSYDSPTLGKPIALALMRNGRAALGGNVDLWHDGTLRLARVCSPVFLDPEGDRLHA